MKRKLSFLMLIIIISSFLLSACGKKEELVTIELPKYITEVAYNGMDQKALDDMKKANKGFEEIVLNDDGTMSIKVTKEMQTMILNNISRQANNMITELKSLEELSYVKDIKIKDGFKNIEIIVDKDEYGEAGNVGIFLGGSLGGMAGTYQSYSNEEIYVEIIVDDEDGVELEKLIYPEDFREFLGI